MIKFLIIEDDKVLSENILEMISELGQATQAFDGTMGLYEAESGIYDLLILDLMLPEMNGYEVLAKLREEGIQTPVLILTAKDGLEDKISGFQKGADDYLTKPFYREELVMRIKAIPRSRISPRWPPPAQQFRPSERRPALRRMTSTLPSFGLVGTKWSSSM